jgi:predicted nucleic acid-binding protein
VSHLFDTNVVSEYSKPVPDRRVVEWLDQIDEDRVFISVITVAELRRGTERLVQGRRRQQLEDWLRVELLTRFAGRVLPVTQRIAEAWGLLMANRDTQGRPMHVMDAFIAATAEVHGLSLVTRNVSDFQGSVRSILNPWSGE